MSETASSMNAKQRSEHEKDKRINLRLEHFLKTWQPNDPIKSYEFNADVMMLIREIHIDAQEPIRETMMAIMDKIPQSILKL